MGFLFLETDLLLELGILDDLVQSRGNLSSSITNFGKSFLFSDREDFSSSKESTISTSLIHNIASDGKSEPLETCVLNLVFHTKNDDGMREPVEL